MKTTKSISSLELEAPRHSPDPEHLTFDGRAYSHASKCATTFSIINDDTVVMSETRPHHFLINGLRKMRSARDRKTLAEFGGSTFPAKMKPLARQWFLDRDSPVLGTIRATLKSGRLWRNIPDDRGELFSYFSFWVPELEIEEDHLLLLCRALRVKTDFFVEYLDSRRPHYCHIVKEPVRRISARPAAD